jgi:tRNA threonylcarbamoyladenosine modification (KEOPS) complex  Pcc1 subunit
MTGEYKDVVLGALECEAARLGFTVTTGDSEHLRAIIDSAMHYGATQQEAYDALVRGYNRAVLG